MKQNLLSITQSILSDMDSENVNSIQDSVEAEQVARVVRDTFYNLIATREVPELSQLIKLEAASDSNFPTHFKYGTNVKQIEKVWYTDRDGHYYEVRWVEPLDFLNYLDPAYNQDVKVVKDKTSGTLLHIRTDAEPRYYTSFDENWIVMDSFNKDRDNTLQESKSRAYGTVYPVFELVDTFVPQVDAVMFPYLIAEAKSTAMSLLKGSSDPKIEQAARRQKNYIQNDKFRTQKEPQRLSNYGRRGHGIVRKGYGPL